MAYEYELRKAYNADIAAGVPEGEAGIYTVDGIPVSKATYIEHQATLYRRQLTDKGITGLEQDKQVDLQFYHFKTEDEWNEEIERSTLSNENGGPPDYDDEAYAD